MGFSQSNTWVMSQVKLKFLARFFAHASASEVETVEILLDMDQLTDLLASREEMRCGRVVSFQDAFEDLLP